MSGDAGWLGCFRGVCLCGCGKKKGEKRHKGDERHRHGSNHIHTERGHRVSANFFPGICPPTPPPTSNKWSIKLSSTGRKAVLLIWENICGEQTPFFCTSAAAVWVEVFAPGCTVVCVLFNGYLRVRECVSLDVRVWLVCCTGGFSECASLQLFDCRWVRVKRCTDVSEYQRDYEMTWNETPRWISPGYRGTLSPLFDQVEFLGYSTQLRFSAVAQMPICNSE